MKVVRRNWRSDDGARRHRDDRRPITIAAGGLGERPEILHECRLPSGVQQYEDTSRSREEEVVQRDGIHDGGRAGGGLFIIISIDGYS